MFNLKPVLLASLFIVCLGISNALLAIDYQVELIVFEHLNSSASLEAEPRIDTRNEYRALRNYNRVAKEDLQLSDQAQQIRGSRNFRLLQHFAWSQEGLAKKDARSLDLARMMPNADGIQGTLTLYLARYLHLEVFMQKQVTDSDLADGYDNYAYVDAVDRVSHATKRTHLMREKRRMRSNETHYIDHPHFGIIARITPLEASP